MLGAEVIAEGQLAVALEEQKQTGRPLGMTLVALGFLDEETLVRTLARQLSLPVVWMRGKRVRKPVLGLVPGHLVVAHRCLPVRVDEKDGSRTLLLAMEDPADLDALDEAALAAGMPVRPVLAAPSELEESIRLHHPEISLAAPMRRSPPAAAADASFDRELLPGIEEDGLDSEAKDDACMTSDLADSFGKLALDDDAAAPDVLRVDAPTPERPRAPWGNAIEDGLGSVGPEMILRAVSQLLVEKGVIAREELVDRIGELRGDSETETSVQLGEDHI